MSVHLKIHIIFIARLLNQIVKFYFKTRVETVPVGESGKNIFQREEANKILKCKPYLDIPPQQALDNHTEAL